MSKDPLSGALSRSLQDEDAAVEQRFARVDSILGGQRGQRAARQAKPTPTPKARAVRATFTLAEADYALLPALQQRCLEGRQAPPEASLYARAYKRLLR